MKSIPVSSILYFLLSLGVLFVNANTFTDSQIFPKWMFMFAGLGVIGCLFSFYLFLGKRFVCNAKCCYYTVIISCFLQAGYGILQFFNILSSHSITYNVVGSLIILPVLQEVYAQGYHLPSIFYNIQTKRFNGPVGVHCLLLS